METLTESCKIYLKEYLFSRGGKILNQQESLLDTIKNIPELIDYRLRNFDRIKKQLSIIDAKNINVIASGTSFNAAMAIKTIAWKYYSIELNVFYPNFFSNNFSKRNFDKSVPYIFISQGGKTISTIRSIELVNSLGGTTISLTEDLNTPVAEASEISIEIGSLNEKFLFRTAGYSLSVLTMYLMILTIAFNNKTLTENELQTKIDDLKPLANNINTVIEQTEDWYKEIKQQLTDVKTLYIASGSEIISVSQEAEIKLMEMVPIQSNSFEIEELIHGPQNIFDSSIAFMLLVNNMNDFEKAKSIDKFLKKEIKAFSQIVTKSNVSNENKHVILDSSSTELDILIFITFIQVFSYFLSIDRARNLSKRLNASIDKYFNKTVEG